MRGRHLRALALAACALAALPQAAPAQTALTVVGPTGHTTAVALDPLLAAPDVRDRAYTVRSASGTERRTVTGVSLAAVLDAADARVEQFRYAEVEGGGTAVLFSHEQALDREWDGDGPPVFFAGAGGVGFLRPSAGGDDLNGADELAPGTLTVRLRQKIRMTVTATASKRAPGVGDAVTFTAKVAGVGAGEPVRLSWLFGDDRTGRGAEVEHTYRRAGTFRVLVTATTAGDPVGASAIVTVKVGAAKEPESAPAAASAQDAGDGGLGAGGGSGRGDGAAAGGGPVAAAAPSRSTAPAKDRAKERRRRRPERVPADAPVPGEIAGEVLEATPARPVAAPARRVAATVPREDASGGLAGLPPAAWTGVGASLALLAGWGLERRRWRGEAAA